MLKILKRKKKLRYAVPKEDGLKGRKSEDLPKNGPLVLRIGLVLLLMGVLAYGNYSLVREPPGTKKHDEKRENRLVASRRVVFPEQAAGSSSGDSRRSTPEFTFYKELEAPEEQVRPPTKPESPRSPTEHESSSESSDNASETQPQHGSSVRAVHPPPSHVADRKRVNAGGRQELPSQEIGKKRYTVQVGAFSQPRVARGWAAKWKRKGYKVILKPVARPSTGVIYRLYLGDFPSKKQADKLVKRLRAKEGITAFRLVLR